MICITGATGFLGSHLTDALTRRYDVLIVKRQGSDLSSLSGLKNKGNVRFIDIDNASDADIEVMMSAMSVRTIIHCATSYGRNSTSLTQTLEANLTLPIRILEAGLKTGAETFINTDSFFNKDKFSYSNLAHYSLSKKSLKGWLEMFAAQIQVVNVMLEHVYGPNDSLSKFIPSMIRSIAVERHKTVALTHGHQKRDFVHVNDVVDAYLTIIDKVSPSPGWLEFNVGTGEAHEIRRATELIKKLSGSNSKLIFGALDYRKDEIMYSAADTASLKQLDWHASTTLEEGLGHTLDC